MSSAVEQVEGNKEETEVTETGTDIGKEGEEKVLCEEEAEKNEPADNTGENEGNKGQLEVVPVEDSEGKSVQDEEVEPMDTQPQSDTQHIQSQTDTQLEG